MRAAGLTGWVRSLRGPKEAVDPRQPVAWRWDRERNLGGAIESILTVFLAGAECRFTCTFCDLWRHTLDGATPPAAVPRQLAAAIAAADPLPPGRGIKLYNASNFFDARAVPPQDFPAIADLVEPFDRVIVESHPRLLGRPALEFADLVSGRLEVAMGLEIADTPLLGRLNKRMTLEDFEGAVRFLTDADIAVRVFVLLAPPFVPRAEAVAWALRSVAYAVECGVAHVSIVPTRGTTEAMEALRRDGDFEPPTLEQAEDALEQAMGARGPVVTLDLWDAEQLVSCARCGPRRLERLARMNLTGRLAPRPPCAGCGWR